jgi:hypothetical protein
VEAVTSEEDAPAPAPPVELPEAPEEK